MDAKSKKSKYKKSKYPDFSDIDCVKVIRLKDADKKFTELLDFDTLLTQAESALESSSIKIRGKVVKIPRKQAGFGDFTYYYNSMIEKSRNPLTPVMEGLIEWFMENNELIFPEQKLKTNFCFMNLYENNNHYIGYHSDDEKMLDKNQPIISLTIYDTKLSDVIGWPFRFKCKKTNQVYEERLGHGDLLIMFNDCQKRYKHSVPKLKSNKGRRINLTFRTMIG